MLHDGSAQPFFDSKTPLNQIHAAKKQDALNETIAPEQQVTLENRKQGGTHYCPHRAALRNQGHCAFQSQNQGRVRENTPSSVPPTPTSQGTRRWQRLLRRCSSLRLCQETSNHPQPAGLCKSEFWAQLLTSTPGQSKISPKHSCQSWFFSRKCDDGDIKDIFTAENSNIQSHVSKLYFSIWNIISK